MRTATPCPLLLDPRTPPAQPLLACVLHGADGDTADVALPVLSGPALEAWPAHGEVAQGTTQGVRWRRDDHFAFLAIDLPDGDIERAATEAYARLLDAAAALGHPHLLRLWNFFPAINQGEGDAERYRLFVRGRALALDGVSASGFPAATAIGTRGGGLVVYGLAAREAGVPLENPRQVPAWRYPRRYGPVAPGFARAVLAADGTLLISGTAAVLGHASAHVGDVLAQFDEAMANVAELCRAAEARHGAGRLRQLKIYLRHAADASRLAARLDATVPTLMVHGDICREELLVEVEGVWTPGSVHRAPARALSSAAVSRPVAAG